MFWSCPSALTCQACSEFLPAILQTNVFIAPDAAPAMHWSEFHARRPLQHGCPALVVSRLAPCHRCRSSSGLQGCNMACPDPLGLVPAEPMYVRHVPVLEALRLKISFGI